MIKSLTAWIFGSQERTECNDYYVSAPSVEFEAIELTGLVLDHGSGSSLRGDVSPGGWCERMIDRVKSWFEAQYRNFTESCIAGDFVLLYCPTHTEVPGCRAQQKME